MNKYREVWSEEHYKFNTVDSTSWIPIEEYEPISLWARFWMWVSK